MNRRDFIKVISGAVGVCLVTPRIPMGNAPSVIDGETGEPVVEEPNTVTITVGCLMAGTDIWIGTISEDGIGQDTIWRGQSVSDDTPVEIQVPVKFEGQQVVMRTIHRDLIYQQHQFICDKSKKIDVVQVLERNYAPA